MAQAATVQVPSRSFREYEFLIFSLVSFIGKSYLLIRLPYRPWQVNTLFTCALLALFYCYFRFRYGVKPPLLTVLCLGGAVAVDVLGNYLGLYGHKFGPVMYDEFAHAAAAGMSFVPTLWLLRATTERFGHRLPHMFLIFTAASITFSFAAYYEILELWDEKFYGDFQRLWTPTDSANDLQFGLAGILCAALLSLAVMKLRDRAANRSQS